MIIVTLLGSATAGTAVTLWVNRKKISAEAEVLVGKSWQEYAEQHKRDYEKLRDDFNEMGKKVANLEGTIQAKDAHIATLERLVQNRNPDLEATLKKIEQFMGAILALMKLQGITIPMTGAGEVDLERALK